MRDVETGFILVTLEQGLQIPQMLHSIFGMNNLGTKNMLEILAK